MAEGIKGGQKGPRRDKREVGVRGDRAEQNNKRERRNYITVIVFLF